MYRMNDLDMWDRRRDELLREAEKGRLIQHLRAMRPNRSVGLRGIFPGRAMEAAPSRLCAEDGGRA